MAKKQHILASLRKAEQNIFVPSGLATGVFEELPQDEKEVYGEVMKWQKPVKDGYEQIKGGVERVSKLLEVTALPYEKQTQIRLLLDKATEVSDLIEKDGSWGAHASHYLQDRVKSALSYIDQAQTLLDKGGY